MFVNILTHTSETILVKFGSMTDIDIGKNQLNLGHDPEEILRFSFKNLLIMCPLDNDSEPGLCKSVLGIECHWMPQRIDIFSARYMAQYA